MARSRKTWTGALIVLALLQATTLLRPATAQVEPPDIDEIREHYSLYWEHFKNGNYEDALPDLRWILENAPGFPQNNDRNFLRGVTLFDSLAARAGDPAQRRAYLNEAIRLFDEVVVTLPEHGIEVDEFRWTRNKGRFIQHHLDALPDQKDEAIAAYREAYDLDPNRLDVYYIDVILRDMLSKEQYAEILDLLYELEVNRGGELEIQNLRDKYLRHIPLEAQADFWRARYDKTPGDVAVARQLLDILIELERWDEVEAIAEALVQQEPTPALLRLLADHYLNNGDYARALELYEQLLAMPETEPTAEIYYKMGFAAHQQNNLIPARAHYRKAIALDPGYGNAYLAIGDLYVAAVSQCAGATLEHTDRAVYWLAVDWWQKARQAAPSDARVVTEATLKIDTYRQYFPDRGKIFFLNLTPGQSFSINYGCYSWIGETTTVRAS